MIKVVTRYICIGRRGLRLTGFQSLFEAEREREVDTVRKDEGQSCGILSRLSRIVDKIIT